MTSVEPDESTVEWFDVDGDGPVCVMCGARWFDHPEWSQEDLNIADEWLRRRLGG